MSNLLVLGDIQHPRYHSVEELSPLLNELKKTWSITILEEYEDLTEKELKNYEIIINYIDNWEEKGSKGTEEALYDYIMNGGKMLTLHNGIILKNAATLLKMQGAIFQGHDSYQSLLFDKTEIGHEITAGLKAFSMQEEPYEFHMLSDIGKTLIITYEKDGNIYPAGWVSSVDKGKLVYFCFGHNSSSFIRDEVKELCLKAVSWLFV